MNKVKLTANVKPQEEVIVSSASVRQIELVGAGKSDNDESPRIGLRHLAGAALNGSDNEPSFLDQIYDRIDSLIGGDNPNQFLCLTIPGQALTAEDFVYDYKNNAEKGPTVEANESRLANKLFDPCRVTGADNGMTLPYQYRTALDMLTPKLNAKIAKAKNQLRELLLTPYPFDFGEGETKNYTLQEVFYRLYDDYVAAEQAWSEKQNNKKEELRKQYPDTSSESNVSYNDAYLQWYESVVGSETLTLNEKRSRVLSVFAPNDMDILDGILDSGSGAELEQARQVLENTQKQTPDGGVIYPVKFNPANWFELLACSFVTSDLLESPAALSMRMSNLTSRRITLTARIDELSALIPEDADVNKLKAEVENARMNLDNAQNKLIESYGEGFKTVITTAFDISSLFVDGGVSSIIIKKLADGLKFPSGKNMDGLIKDLTEKLQEGSKAQSAYVEASQKLSEAMMDFIESKNLQNMKSMLSPMKEQLDKVNVQIAEIQTKIQLSTAVINADGGGNGSLQDVMPPEVPDGYTQILIETSASNMNKQSDKHTDVSSSTSGVNFWFAGCSSKKDASSSGFAEITDDSDSVVRIGMNVAKVGIEREWFNPGVFVLTKDMFNVSTVRIAPDGVYTGMTDERLKEMGLNYVFPCYPVAMLIARDISIQLQSNHNSFSSFATSSEEHASHGGGFLFFSGSKSSSNSSSSSSVHASSSEHNITIKFSTPQIIGYYLQATPADKSTALDDISGEEAAAGYVTIARFVEEYKELLHKMRENNNL